MKTETLYSPLNSLNNNANMVGMDFFTSESKTLISDWSASTPRVIIASDVVMVHLGYADRYPNIIVNLLAGYRLD